MAHRCAARHSNAHNKFHRWIGHRRIVGHNYRLLDQLDLAQELALQSENRDLGPLKYRRQVLDFSEDIRVQLATALYCWAAQSGLPQR